MDNKNNVATPAGETCPHCGKGIGVLASVIAPLPNRMRCRRCRAKIGYIGNYWPEYLFSSLVFGAIIFALVFPLAMRAIMAGVSAYVFISAYVLFCLLLWLVIGSLLSLYLMRRKALFLREPPDAPTPRAPSAVQK